MNVPILLKTSNLYNNYLVSAVGATRNAITYLSRRKEVDPKRIGMIGLSWGGVITLLTNGQDQRLAAAVNIFGAGYIPEGCTWEDDFRSFSPDQVKAWYNYLDPKNFLLTQHAPILFMSGTNDHCYYLPTFQKSFEEIPGTKALWLIANARHRFLPFMDQVALAWFDKYLKQRGGFEEPRIISIEQASDNSVNLKVKAAADEAVAARLYYNRGGPSYWTEKRWLEVLPINRDYGSGEFTFVLPARVIDPEILFYTSVKDIFAGNFSTPVRSLFKVKTDEGKLTYGVSSAIKHTYRHDDPITLLNGDHALSQLLMLDRQQRAYRPLSSSLPAIRSMPGDERRPDIL